MDYEEILRAYSVDFESAEGKIRIKCPWHDDKTASAAIFAETGAFYCLGCGKKSNIYSFLARKLGETPSYFYHTIQKDFGVAETKVIPATNIERFHNALWREEYKDLKNELYKRGITDKTIRERKLGVNKDRIVIPIFNAAGYVVNIRYYLPGAATKKVINHPHFGKPIRYYPIEQLGYDQIALVGGEVKSLAAIQQLNEHNIGAISGTWGEPNFTKDFLEGLRGHIVYVIMDIDDAGKEAAKKACIALQDIATEIYLVTLPLDKKKFPHGDINDYVVNGGSLLGLIQKATPWSFEAPSRYDTSEEAEEVTITEAINARNAKKRLRFRALVSAVEPSPFGLPQKVKVHCTRDHKLCPICSVPNLCKSSEQILEVERESDSLLKMAGVSDKEQHRVLCEEFGIPKRCDKVAFDPQTFYNVEHVCLAPELEIASRENSDIMQGAYIIGDGIHLNSVYILEGRSFPHPRTQQITFLISSVEATQDYLENYTPSDIESLKIFQPKEWTIEGLQKKLDEIYEDFEANVTRIFKRRNLHLAADLTYHSPLLFCFDGEKNEKGWVQTLVLGDSSVGKSKTFVGMMDFYGLGEHVDCDGASVAGLIGGVQKFGETWFVTWGKIPSNDRGLVLLEELKGLSVESITKLKDTRSSGEAVLTKVKTRRTLARARLLATSNPRSDIPISGYNFGVDAVRELIGGLENIRRFDLVIIPSKDEVDISEIQKHRPRLEHKFTSELCRDLVLFCWTCKNVIIEDESFVFEETNRLCNLFSDEVPIVDRGSMRIKLSKLAAALAGRTFSIKDDATIVVRRCHIEYVSQFIEKEYSKPAFGYRDFSRMIFESENLVNKQAVRHHIKYDVKHSEDFVVHVLNQDLIDIYFIQDIIGWDRETASNTLSFLIRQRALKREGRYYRKTSSFVSLLKEIRDNPGEDDLPEHLRKDKY